MIAMTTNSSIKVNAFFIAIHKHCPYNRSASRRLGWEALTCSGCYRRTTKAYSSRVILGISTLLRSQARKTKKRAGADSGRPWQGALRPSCPCVLAPFGVTPERSLEGLPFGQERLSSLDHPQTKTEEAVRAFSEPHDHCSKTRLGRARSAHSECFGVEAHSRHPESASQTPQRSG